VSAATKKLPKGDGLIPKDKAQALSRAFIIVAVVGVAVAGAGFAVDTKRAAFSWLVGFAFVWTICMGGLFFTIIHHLTRASWSVGPRRVMEWLARGLPACAVVFLPILAFSKDIFLWLQPGAEKDHLIHAKAAYLNQPFFLIRVVVFFGLWILLSRFFAGKSREQDTSGARSLSERMQGMAAPSAALFALSISFAGFDWLMSLDPHWYSTMFGVYVFAGALVGSHSVLALATMRINKERWGGDVVTTEHQHDVGKYLFAWVVFWAYIGFSQFMLIWYANIPEETIWYRHRWEHGWHIPSLALFVGHFILPFLILLSRTAKRSGILAIGAVLLLAMHYVDLYWLIMPVYTPGHTHEPGHFHPSWIDIGGLLGPLGLVGAWVSRRALVDPVIPMKDPYLPDAMKAENLV
jgi:hypothetical protein